MGAVYRAVDEMVDRNVAIKVLRSEISSKPELIARFCAEAKALARLNHPSIATLYSFFREGEQYFMAMEFVAGETLEEHVQRQGPYPWRETVAIMRQVLASVGHAHQAGVLHRDLKPSNILLAAGASEGPACVKVTDFGIACMLNGARLTREAHVVGTLEYLAPERALGQQADARADLYSLGVILFEMLTGKLPFRTDSDAALLRAQIEAKPPRVSELGVVIPAALETVLAKTLAKNPNERYASAAEMAQALEACLTTLTPIVPAKRPVSAMVTKALKQKLVLAAGTALVILMLGAFAASRSHVSHSRKRLVDQPVTMDALSRSLQSTYDGTSIAPPVVIPAAPPRPAPTPVPTAKREQTSAKRVQELPAPPPSVPHPTPTEKASATPPPEPVVHPQPASLPPKRHMATLYDIRSLYVTSPNQELTLYVQQEIANQFVGRLQLLNSASAADATLRISLEDQHGNHMFKSAGRFLGVTAGKHASAQITLAENNQRVWMTEVGDRHALAGAWQDSAHRIAARIAHELRQNWRE